MLSRTRRAVGRITRGETTGGWRLLVLAALVGAGTAWAVVLFYGGIALLRDLSYGTLRSAAPTALQWLLPTLAITVALYIVRFLVGQSSARPGLEPVTPDDPVSLAMRRMTLAGVEYLPVVDQRRDGRLVGLISAHQIWRAYDAQLLSDE